MLNLTWSKNPVPICLLSLHALVLTLEKLSGRLVRKGEKTLASALRVPQYCSGFTWCLEECLELLYSCWWKLRVQRVPQARYSLCPYCCLKYLRQAGVPEHLPRRLLQLPAVLARGGWSSALFGRLPAASSSPAFAAAGRRALLSAGHSKEVLVSICVRHLCSETVSVRWGHTTAFTREDSESAGSPPVPVSPTWCYWALAARGFGLSRAMLPASALFQCW